VSDFSTLLNGTTDTVIASSLKYRPDGQLSTMTLGNGETATYTYDTGGRRTLNTRSAGNPNESFTWNLDALLTIRALTSDARKYQYDTLQRLKNEGTLSTVTQSFTYDANGNRLSNGSNAYTYLANSNRMATRKGVAITRDAAGNHTNNGLGQTYAWDTQGHYVQFSLNGVQKATYLYNYQHQRVQKTLWNGATNLGSTLYHYDLAGRLLAETSTTGTVQAVYLYDDNGTPLAIVQAANSPYNNTSQDKLVYLQTDHLGTPRLATDAAKRTVINLTI
jgi:YD repeat-containing protein